MHKHIAIMNLWHDFRDVCVFISVNSVIANFLPKTSTLKNGPHWLYLSYCYLVDLIAAFAMNWRTQLPSLDAEFLGFRRMTRHYVRNRMQDFADWRHRDTFSDD